MTRDIRLRFWGAALGAAMVLAACQGGTTNDSVGAPESAAEPSAPSGVPTSVPLPEPMLRLDFERRSGENGTFDEMFNAGDASVEVQPATWGDGEVRSVPSLFGRGARFPAFSAVDPGFAVLRVTGIGPDDPLSVGESDFSFGSDVYLDRVSTGSGADNGDNVLQRGLFGGVTQYKLQVDHGRPSCRVAGLGGEVIVSADRALEPETWFRVSCVRRETFVRLEVHLLTADGVDAWSTVSRQGRTGSVAMPRRTVLAIGGKLDGEGTVIPSSTDQFNGILDRVYVRRFD